MLVHAFNWKKLSLCAVLGYRWDGERCRLWFQTRPGSYNDERLIAYLRDLKKHLRGQKAILIWDGLPAHKSRKMKQYLESQRGWLQVEMLPGYSPDLNPVKDLWATSTPQRGHVEGSFHGNAVCIRDFPIVYWLPSSQVGCCSQADRGKTRRGEPIRNM